MNAGNAPYHAHIYFEPDDRLQPDEWLQPDDRLQNEDRWHPDGG